MTQVRPEPKSKTWLQVVQAIAWTGLVGGFAEVAAHGVMKFGFGRATWFGSDLLWMAPLTNLSLFCAGAVIAGMVLSLTVQKLALPVSLFLFGTVAVWGVIHVFPWIHEIAALVLGAGIAYQFSKEATIRRVAFLKMVRGSLPALLIAIPVLATSLWCVRWITEATTLRGLPDASPEGPNIVVVTRDTERAASWSLYGYERETTPNAERLAESSTTFALALSTSSWTLPSHASMFTGRFPDELSAAWDAPLDDEFPTLAEAFGRHGYSTAGFVANTYYCAYEFGLARGFAHFDDYHVNIEELVLSASLSRRASESGRVRQLFGHFDLLGRKNATSLNDDFLGWLDTRRTDRPFLAWLNYFDAHQPFLPPEPFDALFVEGERGWDYRALQHRLRGYIGNLWLLLRPDAAVDGEVDSYDGAIAYTDHELGRLVEGLEERGLLDNTVLVVTSDHGEAHGEHLDARGRPIHFHGKTLYTQEVHVPLMIRYPGLVPSGGWIEEPVTLRDLPRTILELADVDPGGIEGQSLARLWSEASAAEEYSSPILSMVDRDDGSDRIRSIVWGGRYHYIRHADGVEEVYDLSNDPTEVTDLVSSLEPEELLPQMRSALNAALAGPFEWND